MVDIKIPNPLPNLPSAGGGCTFPALGWPVLPSLPLPLKLPKISINISIPPLPVFPPPICPLDESPVPNISIPNPNIPQAPDSPGGF